MSTTLKARATRLAKGFPNATVAEMAQVAEKKRIFVEDVVARWETDPTIFAEIASLIEDQTFLFFNSEINAIAEFITFDRLNRGDKLGVSNVQGIRVHEVAPGAQIRTSQLDVSKYEVGYTQFGYHFRVDLDAVAEFAENLFELIELGAQRMGMTVQKFILKALTAASPQGAANYLNVTGLTPEALTQVLNETGSKAAIYGANLQQLTILGRYPVTSQIFDFNTGFDPEANSELRKTGRIGYYRGAKIVQLADWVDEDLNALVPANELFVIAGTVGKFATLGAPTTKTWDGDEYDTRDFRTVQRLSGIVHHSEAMFRIEDSSIPA